MLPLFLTVIFMLGIYILVRQVLRASFFRAEEESRARLREMMREANPDWADEREVRREKSSDSPLLDRVSNWLSTSNIFRNEEGRDFLGWLDRQLVLAGLQRQYSPYQALSLALTIWTIGIVVPTLFVLGGVIPKLIFLLVVIVFVLYPPMKLVQLKRARADALRSEVPWLIHELSMALATEALTLDEAIARVTRANDPAARRTPLMEEFAQAYLEARLGAREREQAYLDIVDRTEVLEVATLVDTLIAASRTGSNIIASLDQYAEAATDAWRQDTLAFINRQEPRFMIGMVLIVFGIMSWYAAPIIIGAFQSLQSGQ